MDFYLFIFCNYCLKNLQWGNRLAHCVEQTTNILKGYCRSWGLSLSWAISGPQLRAADVSAVLCVDLKKLSIELICEVFVCKI